MINIVIKHIDETYRLAGNKARNIDIIFETAKLYHIYGGDETIIKPKIGEIFSIDSKNLNNYFSESIGIFKNYLIENSLEKTISFVAESLQNTYIYMIHCAIELSQLFDDEFNLFTTNEERLINSFKLFMSNLNENTNRIEKITANNISEYGGMFNYIWIYTINKKVTKNANFSFKDINNEDPIWVNQMTLPNSKQSEQSRQMCEKRKVDYLINNEEMDSFLLNYINNLSKQTIFKQLILFGPPGTGKSYKVEKELLNSIDNKNVIRTTFYQDYEYHNFIGSILPQIDGEILNYNFVPGPFTLALERALNCKTQQVYLIIEEMTRGNCAAIFGDTFQLLDRNNNGESEYPINNLQLEKYLGIEKIKIPNNLSIIGTINTSDQNVFPMDTAFKRRFDFEYVSTDPEYDFVNFNILGDVSWLDFYQKLNEIILDITNSEDKQLGPYFLKENDNIDKLYMYLWQDVLLNGKHSKVNRIFKRNMVTLSKIINCKEKPFVDNLINIEDTNEDN